MKLSQVASVLNSQLIGNDSPFTDVSIDSRTLRPGALFIALKGPNFNGHDFVKAAEQAGAIAAIVSEKVDASIACIQVKDTYKALWDLASYYRQQLTVPFFAMTGSCGKTTTKTLIASILRQRGKVHANPASFNNDIGVPLTVLQVDPTCDYAVTEIGANHLDEISLLTRLVKPNVALITNAAPVHLEGFGGLDGVAKGKGEIFQGLAQDGVAVINADDSYADYWRDLNKGRRIVTFGLRNNADVMASDIILNEKTYPTFTLSCQAGERIVNLNLMGEHNVYNAVAAAAATLAHGVSLEDVVTGLNQATAEKQRLVEHVGLRGAVIIDDTYNANPVAAKAAINILQQRAGSSILVLGDMLELGDAAESLHRDVGKCAAESGIDQLYCLGKFSRYAAEAFGQHGYHFENHDDLIKSLKSSLQKNMTVLVKGSRSMHMERIAQALVGE